MTITGVKAMAAKVVTAAVLAGAVLMAAPTKANAQEVFFAGGFEHRDAIARAEYRRHEFYARHDDWYRRRECRRFDRGFRGYR